MKIRYLMPLFLATTLISLQAEIKPASVFGEHMVLQRNLPIPVWGQADPGEMVTVTLGKQKVTVQAEPDGKWLVRLPAVASGEKLELLLTGSATKEPISFKDVAIGDVWICSGQSNMEFGISNASTATEALAKADNPKLRIFLVKKATATTSQTTVEASWKLATADNLKQGGFSAVGYFFGREIQAQTHVPIGLIGTYWGGTPAEAWTRASALENDPDYENLLKARADNVLKDSPESHAKIEKDQIAWDKQIDPLLANPGKVNAAWFNPADGLKDWKKINVPGRWQNSPDLKFNGAIWFRKVVDVPADLAATSATLSLGNVDDYDFTWVNGKLVGQTGKNAGPKPSSIARNYSLPAGSLKPGQNVILVRVVDAGQYGGLVGKPEQLTLSNEAGAKVELAGEWQYLVDKNLGLRPEQVRLQNTAGALYDAMLAPLIPYGIRGAIWYQGESNAGRAEQYGKLFPAMINCWRKDWGQGDFPFYFVQLANFMAPKNEPADSAWAELREAQFKTLALPHTGMAVAIDVGDAKDIHPTDKETVGKRLALWALAQDYGVTTPTNFLGKIPGLKSFFSKPVVHSGPLYKSMKIEGNAIRLTFDHVGGGLIAKAGPLKYFSIAGEDKNFVWAAAKIVGDTVVVSNPDVAKPVAVRYNWADNPDGNLYNAEGLPASSFRTDDWPGVTAGKR
jgi:sialate O-acetylesterase